MIFNGFSISFESSEAIANGKVDLTLQHSEPCSEGEAEPELGPGLGTKFLKESAQNWIKIC